MLKTVLENNKHFKAKIIKINKLPPEDFIYIFTLNIENGKNIKRLLRKNYFEQHKWLIYSNIKSGLFCKYYVIFSTKGGRHNITTLKKYIIESISTFLNLTGKDRDLEVHNRNKYHITAIQISDDFLKSFNDPKKMLLI